MNPSCSSSAPLGVPELLPDRPCILCPACRLRRVAACSCVTCTLRTLCGQRWRSCKESHSPYPVSRTYLSPYPCPEDLPPPTMPLVLVLSPVSNLHPRPSHGPGPSSKPPWPTTATDIHTAPVLLPAHTWSLTPAHQHHSTACSLLPSLGPLPPHTSTPCPFPP